MSDLQTLLLEGDRLRKSDGTIIATFDNQTEARGYAKLFAIAPDMLSLLEEILEKQVTDFERQLKASQQAVPLSGSSFSGPDKLYVSLPEWVQAGLALLAKLKE